MEDLIRIFFCAIKIVVIKDGGREHKGAMAAGGKLSLGRHAGINNNK